MKRVVLMLAIAGAAWGLAACGGGEVVIAAQLQQATDDGGTEAMALSSLPVRLIPFDRDAVFDSLARAYPEPEPEIPDSIFDLRDRVIEAQSTWREAESEWSTMRDSLQAISDRMEGMDKSSGEYFALFQDFNELDGRVSRLEERSNALFDAFTELQDRLNAQSREISITRQNWADDAFASVDSVFLAMQDQLGREEMYDTTDAEGVVAIHGVAKGRWWVTARYDRQFDELYWNVPIEVTGGDPLQVQLTEDNAEVRHKM